MINITQKEFELFSAYIETHYGIHLKGEKLTLLEGRLQNVITQIGLKSFTAYYDYIIADRSGAAATILVNKITTNHTYFMRETSHFYYLRDQVLPFLVKTVKDKDLCIWCAASSTGEEPYTLAMIVDEFLKQDKMWWDAKILATDLSTNVLEIAQKGIYSKDKIAALPSQWKLQYFRDYDHENVIVSDKIKNELLFRKFNLMDDVFPFKKKFHVIFCRNVMIYFENKTKRVLLDKLYDSLHYGGYLFIGHSESINRETSRFKYICPAVYRKE